MITDVKLFIIKVLNKRNINLKSFFFVGMLASVLFGCASKPTNTAIDIHPATQQLNLQVQHLQSLADIHSFELNGRIAVQMEKHGFSAITHWQHTQNQDVMEIFSPFGSKLAVINRTDKLVKLITSDKKELQASSVEVLTEQVLAFKLPLSGLTDWVLARPSLLGEPPIMIEYDSLGHIILLSQQGWDIEYSDYKPINNKILPSKIFLKSAKLNLKLLIDSWQLSSADKVLP